MNKIFTLTVVSVASLVFVLSAQTVSADTNCRIQMTTPVSSVSVLFPLKITGVLLPSSSACADEWLATEKELGSAVLVDANNILITEQVTVPLFSKSPTSYPKMFSVVLRLKELKPATSTGSLIIYDKHVPDGDEQQKYVYPVTFGEDPQPTHYFSKKMKYGMKNDRDVKKLQEILISRGYLKGTATGNFLSGTQKAVMEYQKDHNLPATGICGDMTRILLNDNE